MRASVTLAIDGYAAALVSVASKLESKESGFASLERMEVTRALVEALLE
jgi:hypothetical protein